MFKVQREELMNFYRKYLYQFYFLFFIFLNIIDFFNIIGGDLDFFKKLLSWLVIGYLFYHVSFTKSMIGKKLLLYDLLFLLGFSLMSLIKALVLYSRNIDNFESYRVFGDFLFFIATLPPNTFISLTFILGFLLTLILSISLLLNHGIRKGSFIGSFNIKEGFFKYPFEQGILSVMALFFGMILFNLFMEWFALAVDSIILVLGLSYYLILVLQRHHKGQLGNYTRLIANTGNNFFQTIIQSFSEKKTILIALSFLLTLHALVDAGVYLIPYTIGTENALYFNDLGTEGHQPIFSLKSPSSSLLLQDIFAAENVWIAGIYFLTHLSSLFVLYCFLVLPFYILYNNVNGIKLHISRLFGILFLGTSFYYILLLLFLPQVHPTLMFSTPEDGINVRGIDIISLSLSQGIGEYSAANPYLLAVLLIVTLVVFLGLIFKYLKYRYFFQRLLLFVLMIFFLFYILNFFVNFTEREYRNLSEDLGNLQKDFLEFEEHKQTNELLYLDAHYYYEQEEHLKINAREIELESFILEPHLFSSLKSVDSGSLFVLSNQSHEDYVLLKLKHKENLPFYIITEKLSSLYFESNDDYSLKRNNAIEISQGEVNLIVYLGSNVIQVEESGENYRVDRNAFSQLELDSYISLEEELPKARAQDKLVKFIEYVRLIFTSLFYSVGILSFAIFYIRRNLLTKQE
jgi:hypothetical protein